MNRPTTTVQKHNTKPFWKDKRNARPGEQIGGGFIVVKRGRGSGRVRMSQWPFEHPSMELAQSEAKRMSAKWPGRTFIVIQIQGPVYYSETDEA